jgi:uncharacterized protein
MGKVLSYGSYGKDNPERATLAFIVGNTAVASDKEAVVFLTAEGVRLVTKGYADEIHEEGYAPVKDLIQQYVSGGGTLIACSACCQPRGISESDLIDGAEIAGAARLVEYLSDGYAPFTA